ncbi:hypothetical protein CDD82_2592 [Ophiocordyceps australis]|uniref:trimethyllysine dioxygenase n=1 Tax=Ophiocordyceps australis TaxID=1399860 RepID=A0A2C5ZIR3_9HYPO|nr:hypothetical protein CDD82_2592 [Ophiocordyceps australis]
MGVKAAFTIPNDASRINVDNARLDEFKLMVAWKGSWIWFSVDESDGRFKSRGFHATRIRDGCNCSKCRDPTSGNKLFSTADIPPDLEVLRVEEEPLVGLRITFSEPEGSGEEAQHETMVPWSDVQYWTANRRLRRWGHLPTMAAVRRRFKPFFWKSAQVEKQMKRVSWEELQGPKGVFKVLEQVTRLGLVVVTDVPPERDAVEAVARRLGPLRETFYGRTFEVRVKADADNVAYTGRALPLHQDLLYLSPPPRIQLLHCYDDGGAAQTPTVFCDAERIGRILLLLRMQYPVLDPLFTDPVPYTYRADGHYYHNEHPVIDIDWRDQAYRQLWWSPPFAGHQQVAEYSLGPWIHAAHFLAALAKHPSNTFSLDLEAGQCVIFDNLRLLHGRPAIPPGRGPGAAERLLYGTYIAPDDFYSAVLNLVDIPSIMKFRRFTKDISVEPDLGQIRAHLGALQQAAQDNPQIGLRRQPPTDEQAHAIQTRSGRWRLNGAASHKELSSKPQVW